MLQQGDTVVLTQDSISYRSGAKLIVLEVDRDLGVRVGITPNDGGEWVALEKVEKVC